MPTSAYIIGFLVVALTVLFAVGYQVYLYRAAFHQTAAYRRASHFWQEEARLRKELAAAEVPLPPVPADAIRREAYREQLRASSIGALDDYPGIGGATLQRLVAAGFESLADVERGVGDLPGIGPSRMADVRRAVRAELARQQQLFDAGMTRHARGAASKITSLTAQRDAAIAANEARASKPRRALKALEPYLATASSVTLRAYFWHERRAPGEPFPYDPLLDGDPPAVEVSAPPLVSLPPQTTPIKPAQTSLPVARRLGELSEELDAPTRLVAPKPPRMPPSVEAVATILFHVARADGELSAPERAAVRAGLAAFFQHDPVLVRFIDPTIEHLAVADLNIDAALAFARRLLPGERDLLARLAQGVAGVKGRRHSPEFMTYEKLAVMLAAKPCARRTPSPKPSAAPTPRPAKPPAPPLVAAAPPAGLRDNGLLDDAFAAPVESPVTPAVADDKALRENSLLDAAFGS